MLGVRQSQTELELQINSSPREKSRGKCHARINWVFEFEFGFANFRSLPTWVEYCWLLIEHIIQSTILYSKLASELVRNLVSEFSTYSEISSHNFLFNLINSFDIKRPCSWLHKFIRHKAQLCFFESSSIEQSDEHPLFSTKIWKIWSRENTKTTLPMLTRSKCITIYMWRTNLRYWSFTSVSAVTRPTTQSIWWFVVGLRLCFK